MKAMKSSEPIYGVAQKSQPLDRQPKQRTSKTKKKSYAFEPEKYYVNVYTDQYKEVLNKVSSLNPSQLITGSYSSKYYYFMQPKFLFEDFTFGDEEEKKIVPIET